MVILSVSMTLTKPRIHGGSVTTAQVGAVLSNAAKTDWVTKEGFCHCGAWKGQLGLEPTWQLFIKHMVEISSLIKRVLKPTGSYYLVMGDTYCAKPKSSNSGGMQNENYGNRHSEHGWENRGEDFKQMIKSDPITKPKQLLLIPSRLAIALQEDGWTLRNKIIWYKPNHMPSSVKDRLTNSYEEIFHFVQNRKYYYDLDSIREPHKYEHQPPGNKLIEPGRTPISVDNPTKRARPPKEDSFHSSGKNPGDTYEEPSKHDLAIGRVGNFSYVDPMHKRGYSPMGKNPSDFFKSNTKPYPEAHFAVFPEDICIPRIKCSCPENGTVLDPFAGSGTVGKVALDLGRKAILIEINEDYRELQERRLSVHVPEWREKYAIQDAQDNGIKTLKEFV
jgi:site-specific DNA-methyltransferase (cytosine-N4-specific)